MIYFSIPYLLGAVITYLYPTWFFGQWVTAKDKEKDVIAKYRELYPDSTDEELKKSSYIFHVINASLWLPISIYVISSSFLKKS